MMFKRQRTSAKSKVLRKLNWFSKIIKLCRGAKAIDLCWGTRIVMYGGAIAFAYVLIKYFESHEWLAKFLIGENGTVTDSVVDPNIVLGTFLFVFIISTTTWIIRTFDKKKEFYDSLKVRNDAIFAECTKLALSDKGPVRAQGVLGLARLKRDHPDYKDWIDDVTSATKLDLRETALKHVDLSGANLKGVDLSKADLSGTYLIKANLNGANLTEADLISTRLREAKLRKANLSGAKLIGADLSDARLSEANLSRANLSGANLSEVYLSGANLIGADLSEAKLVGARLYEVNLGASNLSGADLSEAHLSKANLNGANLSGADLSKANLSRANLSGANLRGANLNKTVLRGAKLRDVEGLMEADLVGAKYNDETEFPDDFNPQAYRMTKGL